ncbi:flagellar hook-basal body complex protein FliE [Saccharobesus litoralis]|uniref:Flagellar hook-basal body complex protein FliE n=1 Tax=Saccharobesus litoralis TaxID=2172099 RepID=A0A2S0VT30_9ALTE|nr:flagellar hook-basal body complex protein FliE [Saccharobesus litoralis]AWB67369.1 flagellar hook-basal body complex protein FliE [Saccharobesus litoralis]
MKIGSYDLAANNLYADMQSMSNQAQNRIMSDSKVDRNVINPTSSNFADMLEKAIDNVNELGQTSKEKVTAFEMGDRNVTLADAMIAKEKSGVAFEATVQVRNKVLEAYQKIMQMPV